MEEQLLDRGEVLKRRSLPGAPGALCFPAGALASASHGRTQEHAPNSRFSFRL